MPWLADTHAIALVVGRKPSTIRKWAERHPDQLPRRGTGKHNRALYDVEEAEKLAAKMPKLDPHHDRPSH